MNSYENSWSVLLVSFHFVLAVNELYIAKYIQI